MLSGADYSLVPNGPDSYPLGVVQLDCFDDATITLDLRELANNMTYGSDYQISVYVDCMPCPARYKCNAQPTPGVGLCTTPSLFDQTNYYNECLNKYTITTNTSEVFPDYYRCSQIPFFCDAQVQVPAANGVKYSSSGCCSCTPHPMPYFFVDSSTKDLGYPDNKHNNFVQLSFTALDTVKLAIVVELLNGQYYREFDKYFVDKGSVFIHSPNRGHYEEVNTPANPSRKTFLAVIQASDYVNMQGPLNLPYMYSASAGNTVIETQVLVGRPSDLIQGDPG
jgi:hypothetical protein